MFQYTFEVGLAFTETCIVHADSEVEAFQLARQQMDERCEAEGREPPVAWDLRLVEVK